MVQSKKGTGSLLLKCTMMDPSMKYAIKAYADEFDHLIIEQAISDTDWSSTSTDKVEIKKKKEKNSGPVVADKKVFFLFFLHAATV